MGELYHFHQETPRPDAGAFVSGPTTMPWEALNP